jgi:glycosyltransferase involved in cell wall biosynthesis
MKIYVSMISLNEEAYMEKALSGCQFAHRVAIVDGGSEDGTLDIIKKTKKTTVETHVWQDDFGLQRQHSLALVPASADWWIRLDADEVYSKALQTHIKAMLALLPETVLCVRIRQVNLINDELHYSANRGGWETWPRIFRNIRLPSGESAWLWKGPVHEYPQLMTVDGPIDIADGPSIVNWNVTVLHYGWLSEKRRQDREDLYLDIEGSGFKQGALTNRIHVIREVVNL